MKKIIVFIITIFSMLFYNPTSTEASNVKDLEVISYQEMKIENSNIDNEFKDILNSNGWNISGKTIYRSSKVKYGKILINNKIHKINNGLIKNLDLKNIDTISDLDRNIYGIIEKKGNGYYIKFNLDINKLLSIENDSINTFAYGQKYFPGDWVHCNRFNGIYTDGIHYKKTNPNSYKNFIGSDCDISLANSTKCWGHSYCNQSGPPAGCSKIIGHQTTYHNH